MHSRNDNCYSQATQSSCFAHPMSFQTNSAERARSNSSTAQDIPVQPIQVNSLHKLHCRTVATTYRPSKLARKTQSSCPQTSDSRPISGNFFGGAGGTPAPCSMDQIRHCPKFRTPDARSGRVLIQRLDSHSCSILLGARRHIGAWLLRAPPGL